MRKVSRRLFVFFKGGVGWEEGPVILKGFKGMFAHLLNGLKWVEASIFLSTHLGEGSQEGWTNFTL